MPGGYIGRFAPSPTGALHLGSLVCALASWRDAQAHAGRWLVRMEDLDPPRCVAGAGAEILRQLQVLGLVSSEPVVWQSERHALYAAALAQLQSHGWVYPCGCSRREIELTRQHRTRFSDGVGGGGGGVETNIYPGTCRLGLNGRPARVWRLNVARVVADLGIDPVIEWNDRQMGLQTQDIATLAGDFVLRRADGLWAYQLAVVVDDAAQQVSAVVRGADLLDHTAGQMLLQRALHLPTPTYLHVPLVLAENGEKLSKQNGAKALDLRSRLACLQAASDFLLHSGVVLGSDAMPQPLADSG